RPGILVHASISGTVFGPSIRAEYTSQANQGTVATEGPGADGAGASIGVISQRREREPEAKSPGPAREQEAPRPLDPVLQLLDVAARQTDPLPELGDGQPLTDTLQAEGRQ